MGRVKLFLIAAATVLVSASGVGMVHAQGNVQSGNTVTVAGGKTIDQTLYAAGQTIDIAGTINGDVFCAGQTITVSGTVNGDVICAGQTITVTGKVLGDTRLAGQVITVGAQVNGNVTALGQNVSLESNAQVSQDVSIGAQEVTLNGNVGRDVAIGGTIVALNGNIGRDAVVADTTLALGSGSRIGGNLTYTSYQEVSKAGGAQVVGTTTRKQPSQQNQAQQGASAWGGIGFLFYLFFALLLIALALVLLLPRMLFMASEVAIRSPFKTAGIGLAVSIAVPILLIVLMITVVSIPLALLLSLAWIVICGVAWAFAAYYLGRLLLKGRTRNSIWYMLLGAAIVIILSFVPFIGFFVWLVALWLGLGMLFNQARRLPRPKYES